MNTFPPPLQSHAQAQVGPLMVELEKKMEMLLLRQSDEQSSSGGAVRAAVYHLRSGGRRMRGRLALHASLSLGLTTADALVLATVAELLHNASLIHDDLQDDEITRHGVQTAGVVFGTNVAICAGDLLLSAAYVALASYSQPKFLSELITTVHAATAAAIAGQCAGFPGSEASRQDLVCYQQVVIAKSGALLSLPLQLAFLGSGRAQWLSQARRAAEEFAVGYQIMDDLMDVESDGPLAMNIVTVLKACGHPEDAVDTAHEMGLRHLLSAASLAKLLPEGSGDSLAELAISLSQS